MRCGKNTIRHILSAISALIFYLLSFVAAGANTPTLSDADLIIVGTQLNGVSGPDLDIYTTNNQYWILQTDLKKHLNLNIKADESEQLIIRSPLGTVTAPRSQVAADGEDGLYISTKFLQNKLNIRSEFDTETYSLKLTIPWNNNSATKSAEETQIDFHAPAGALASISLENQLQLTHDQPYRHSENSLMTTGSAGNGLWLVSFAEDEDRQFIPRHFHWSTQTKNTALRIGTNESDISPLSSSLSYTGLQFAWSNRVIEKFFNLSQNFDPDTFITEDINQQKTIRRDDGHPAGVAVLAIDGYRIAAVRIGLDGQYQFTNVVYDADHYQDVTISIFESIAARKPLKVVNLSRRTTQRMLDRGEQFLRFGFGRTNNDLTDHEEKNSQFLLYRFGVSEHLTFHVATAGNSDSPQALAGFSTSFRKHWSLRAELMDSDNKSAVTGSLMADYHHFDTELRITASRNTDAESSEVSEKHDARWRSFWRINPQVKLGLFARHSQQTHSAVKNYILPAVYGNLSDKISFYARPEEDGNYQLSASYHRDHHRLQFIHTVERYSLIRHTLFNTQWRTWHFSAERSHIDARDTELSAQLDWYPAENHKNFIEIGLSHSEAKKGGYLSWNTYTRPGFDVQLQYEHYANRNSDPTRVFWLRTRLNVVKSGRKYMPTKERLQNLRLGTISGALIDPQGNKLNLSEVTMRVNGRPQFEPAINGRYTINNLQPGIYELSVDEDDLPIELVPKETNAYVEVKASAVTNVDFTIEEYYGFAGFVSKNGKPLKNTLLAVTDENNELVKNTLTDDFGYYRVDDLTPATYEIQVPGHKNAAIQVVLVDDYLFDRNIEINHLTVDLPEPQSKRNRHE